MTIETVNPATGTTLASYEETTQSEIDTKLDASAAAFQDWRHSSFSNRSSVMTALKAALESNKADLARQMSLEMGKPITSAVAEVEKCIWLCEHYTESAERYLAPTKIETEATSSYVSFQPIGPVLAVMPWNFPLWQVMRFVVPALSAGNVCLLKHASNVTGLAKRIEELLTKIGTPDGSFSTLVIGGDRVESIIADARVAAVTLTGSDAAGRSVGAAAGKNLKRSVLELGGSDPYVVLADADLEKAAETCVTSRLLNTGQTCISAKRFIAVDSVYDEFSERVVELMTAREVGDPLDQETDLGPLARQDLRDDIADQQRRGVEAGATLALDGSMADRSGSWHGPSVLLGVDRDNPAATEETFGPLAAVMKARDTAHAIELANDTPFGLGAAVFTADVDEGERIARDELDAGCCCVNQFVKSDPRLPFGGTKQSGYGRELADLGMKEFLNAKTVVVA